MDSLVLISFIVIVSMALLSCLCCLCMKLSDLKLRSYILETAKRKGVKLDLESLDPKVSCQSPLATENCSIFVPEVGIIL